MFNLVVYNILNDFKEEESYNFDSGLHWFILKENEINDLPFSIDCECIRESGFNEFSQINFYNEYTFLALSIMEFDGVNLVFSYVNIFLGKNYLITIYNGDSDVLINLISDLRENKNCFVVKNDPSISTFLYTILDRIILKNYSVINSLSSKGDKIEISILKDDSHKNFEELIRLRSQVYRVKKFLNPIRYIGDSLILNENKVLHPKDILLFEKINDKFQKLLYSVENLTQQLSLVTEAYESEIANKTNKLMKVFTLVASIFLPLDLLTSFFGMSFEIMPLKHSCYSVYIITGVMLGIVFILVLLFKKKDWL